MIVSKYFDTISNKFGIKLVTKRSLRLINHSKQTKNYGQFSDTENQIEDSKLGSLQDASFT